MKLTFLGTAAAEGIPALWCECEYCVKAAEIGGKEIRHRTGYLLDDDTIIDFGPDFYSQSLTYKIDLRQIKRVLFTHCHEDHMSPWELGNRRDGFSQVSRKIDVIASGISFKHILQTVGMEFADLKLNQMVALPGEWVSSGDMEIMGIPADHAPGLLPLIFLIQRQGKNLLLAHDTGMLSESAWEMLRNIELSAVVLESTGSLRYPEMESGHLGINGTVRFRDRLKNLGCITDLTQVYVTHFSHNGHAMHDELCAAFGKHDITVAYDGLTIEF